MVFKWSTTASQNDVADSNINWREGQAASTVNNSARAMMAAVAKYRDDIGGKLVTGGTSTAYTVSTSQGISAPIPDGFTVRIRMNATNGAAPTLNVDSTGDKPIQTLLGTAAPTGALQSGGIYEFIYNLSSDVWVVANLFDFSQFLPAGTPTGVMADFVGSSAPSGWVLASGRTIGDASSSATERANADTSALYTQLWNAYSNTICPVSTGRGLSASADFAAHKTLGLLDLRGRATVGKDNMGGSAANRLTNAGSGIDGTGLGNSGGEEAHTLLTAEMPAHGHAVTDPGHHHTQTQYNAQIGISGSLTGGQLWNQTANGNTGNATTGITLANTGGGGAHNNTQPSLVVNKIIKL